MPSITFQPFLRDIKDILKSDFYSIPRFQRPYSWSSENLEDFWRDVVVDNNEGYFIGPMVAYAETKELFNIVDGQQRITSITLALCVLRDLFENIHATAFSSGLQKYIEREDDDSQSHYVLRSEAAGHYLRSQIQAPEPRQKTEPKKDEERAFKKAYDEIRTWLTQRIENLSWEHSDGAQKSEAALALREIRDKILSLQVIWIQLDSEDDAYIIFETLNSRGKDLEAVDLLKNFLLSAIRAENGDLDTARIQWSEMREELGIRGDGANPNKFILHWWLSRREYTAERKLFRLIREKVKKSDAPSVLASLSSDAELYARIAYPDGWQCSRYERGAKESLKALNLFSVRQPRPLLLALLRAYRDGSIRVGRLKSALRAIESYHFISTAVVGVSSTGGVSMMYAAHAREISAATNSKTIHLSIDALVKKLKERVSGRDTFLSEFGEALYYSGERTEAKRLVQYALKELHEFSIKGTAFDHDRCNIEHIGSQSDPKSWTADIGNLLWVDEKLNEELGSKDFDSKKEILSRRRSSYDVADILAADNWGEMEVSTRSQRLAELSYDKVWKIS
jgi:uncharacterized protein with ParB-like and HNH nuclease domain